MAGGGNLGVDVDLSNVRTDEELADDVILFSESTGRMIFEIRPEKAARFEQLMGKDAYCIGKFTQENFKVTGVNGNSAVDEDILGLKSSFNKTFEDKCYVRGP